MQNSNSKAGADAQQSTEADVPTSSSHNAKPNVVRSLPTDRELRRLFENNSDCYADTWSQDGLGAPMVEGEVIQAMTVNKFIAVVKSIWQ